jgi:hypothetical protein
VIHCESVDIVGDVDFFLRLQTCMDLVMPKEAQEPSLSSEQQEATPEAAAVATTKAPSGPYWQMVYYAVAGFFFWSILMVQIPFVKNYLGGQRVIFYITFSYGLSSNLIRLFLIWYYAKFPQSTAIRVADLVKYGSTLTAITMAGFPVSMTLLGTTNPTIGFWICIALTSCMGIFNSLLMNAGFGLMSIAPEKSATFFLLGQTTTSVIAWPIILVLRVIIRSIGASEEQTNYTVAVATLSFAAIFCLGVIPLYFLKTKNHPVFRHLLVVSEIPKAGAGDSGNEIELKTSFGERVSPGRPHASAAVLSAVDHLTGLPTDALLAVDDEAEASIKAFS